MFIFVGNLSLRSENVLRSFEFSLWCIPWGRPLNVPVLALLLLDKNQQMYCRHLEVTQVRTLVSRGVIMCTIQWRLISVWTFYATMVTLHFFKHITTSAKIPYVIRLESSDYILFLFIINYFFSSVPCSRSKQ